jgi:hypothetical protein
MEDNRDVGTGSAGPLEGAMAGLVATAPMTAVMLVLHYLLPAPERYPLEPYRITRRMARRARLSGVLDNKEKLVAATAAAHFSYGAAAGAPFPALLSRLPLPPVLAGALYGLMVWTGSYLGLVPALGILSPATHHPGRRNILMIVAHLVWGSALGWLVQQENKGLG